LDIVYLWLPAGGGNEVLFLNQLAQTKPVSSIGRIVGPLTVVQLMND
jgi:hypothetical protein